MAIPNGLEFITGRFHSLMTPVVGSKADIQKMKAYVTANRTLATPFDIVVEGKTASLDRAQMRDKLYPWIEAGATWWLESLGGEPEERIINCIRQGPPRLD